MKSFLVLIVRSMLFIVGSFYFFLFADIVANPLLIRFEGPADADAGLWWLGALLVGFFFAFFDKVIMVIRPSNK